ncbi:MAG TPA: ATP-binding protein [Baekduia sp.]|nr:ATP-binding protein [Baekduia sp.]
MPPPHRPCDPARLITESSTLAERLAALDAARFVGRERELTLVDALFTDDPPAHVVLVHGPGGIGKSTLLREIARRGAARGWTPRLIDGRDLHAAPGDIERAIGDLTGIERPLLLIDTYERIAAADAWVRTRLLPSLPARTIVVLAGRRPPDRAWLEGGWERLATPLPLTGLPADAANALVRARGVTDDEVAARIVSWAHGSPLALTLAADAVQRDGGIWTDEPLRDHPDLVGWILQRVAHEELDAADLDVIAVAALARSCDQRMLHDVLPDIDAERAYAWLCHRSFAERVGSGIGLHEIVRQAIHADLHARAPERERELRRRIADHLYARGLRGGVRLIIDLVELVENPAVRWGFGADGATAYRADLWRPDDLQRIHDELPARYADGPWWTLTEPLLRQAPDRVVTVRDAADALCGFALAVTPENAPSAAEADPLLGPWLAHARHEHAGEQVLIWRDSLDLVAPGDFTSPVLSLLNSAAILRSGLTNPRWSYIPVSPRNAAALAFADAVGAQHLADLDVDLGDGVRQCHLIDHGEAGMLGGVRDAIYAELGVVPQPPGRAAPTPHVTVDDVRDAFRALDHPLVLAASPLARGTSTEERAISVRQLLLRALDQAFGDSPDEQLLRAVLERGYLDPSSSHERAAHELHVSRATYFRRLRAATRRVAELLIAEQRT